MNKLVPLLFLLAAIGLAQPPRASGVVAVFSTPSGSCPANAPLRYYSPVNTLWGCVLPTYASLVGTWTQIASGGGGGGTVTSVGLSSNLGTIGGSPVTTSGTLTLTAAASNITALFSGCSGVQYLGADGACHAAGTGTVTSVGLSFTGGLVSVGGTPVTTSGTLALTVAGTSGGIPYFSSGSTWASSAALTANLPVIGGGAGSAPSVGTRSGNTTQYVTTTGTQTSGDCVKIDANGNHIANGSACGGGGGASITQGTLASIPGTCTTNDLYFTTDSPYTARCSATNTWTYFLAGWGNLNPLATGSWTSFNLGSTNVLNGGGAINLESTENVDSLHGYCISAPSTPYTITVAVDYWQQSGSGFAAPFLGFSDGTKYEIEMILNQASSGTTIGYIDKWNTSTTWSGSTSGTARTSLSGAIKSLQIIDNGTDKLYSISADGQNFTQIYSETRTTFLTASQYCIGIRTYNGERTIGSFKGILVN